MKNLPIWKDRVSLKVVALALACLFLFNQISYASGNFESFSLKKSTLAPELLMTAPEKQVFLQAKLLCEAIEKKAREAGQEKPFSINDIKEWADQNPSSDEYKDVALIDYGTEVHLFVKGTLLIRYFDPEKTRFKFLFPEDKTCLLISQTGPVTPSLQREVYKLTLEEPERKTCEDVFTHIIKKAGLEDRVEITVDAFSEELTDDQYPICEIQKIDRRRGRLVIHPEFVQDYNDIKKARIGFPRIFDDGEMRWIDLADSITYRAAMHEFRLPRRKGHGHAYLDDEGVFQILKDAELNNTIGRRYSVTDDAMWLWYLHSYKAPSDDVRYDNNAFLWRIHNWLFYSDSEEAEAARREFPVLVKDAGKREEAIRLALSINKIFFIDRKARGIDTTPAFKKERIHAGKAKYAGGIIDSAFAADKKDYRKVKPEREFTEAQAEVQASVTLQLEIATIMHELRAIHDGYKTVKEESEKDILKSRENQLLVRLAALYGDITINMQEISPEREGFYRFYSKLLKGLKKEREALYADIENTDSAIEEEQGKKAKDRNALNKLKAGLAELNRSAIRLNKAILKIQVKLAGALLRGRSKIPRDDMKRNAAIWSLKGALYSAKALEIECVYRVERLRGRKIIREIETTDWLGQLVRTFRLGAFDIQVIKPRKPEEAPRVSVRQQRWINVHAQLEGILRDVRNDRKEKALERLDTLIRLYGLRYVVVMESYKNIAGDLKAIRKLILGLPDAHAPPKDKLEEITRITEDLISKITHPKQRVWVDVVYGSLDKALRGAIEKIAGYEPESIRILKNKADLEYYRELLKVARIKGRLAQRNRKVVLKGLARIIEWLEAGFVFPKQFAAIDLKPVMQMIKADNFGEAEKNLRDAINMLETRLQDIERITSNVKTAANALYNEFRDKDIIIRIDDIQKAVNKGEYDDALSQCQEIRELYFAFQLVEPGYIRAEHTLRLAESAIRALFKLKQIRAIELTKEKAREYLSLIKLHIERKNLPQFGKRARLKSVKLQKKKGTAEVLDSKGGEHTIDLTSKGHLDIAALKVQFGQMEKLEESHRDLILAILSRLELSPPKFYTFNTAVEDLLGFADEGKDLIALHENLAQDPVALFHEIGEYLVKKGMLDIEVKDGKIALLLSGVRGKGRPKTGVRLVDIIDSIIKTLPKILHGRQAILAAMDTAKAGLQEAMDKNGIAEYDSGTLYSDAREDDIPELVAEIPIDATLLGDEDWWGQGGDLSPHYSLRVLQRQMFKDRDLALTKAVRDIQAAQGGPVTPVIVQRGAKAEPVQPTSAAKPEPHKTPLRRAPKTRDAIHNEIVRLKGRIFEQVVLRLYRAAGIDVEYQAPMPGNEFIEENRYPDFVVNRERIVDAKWGLASEDIINTILKYTRLSRMYEYDMPVTVIVYEPDYIEDIAAYFAAVNQIIQEDESIPESERKPIEYEIIVFDNKRDSFMEQVMLATKRPEAREAAGYASGVLAEVNVLLAQERKDNTATVRKALIKILRRLQSENNEEVEKPETATPLSDVGAWQENLRTRYIENPEALVKALEFTKKYHLSVWEEGYCNRLQAYLSFILDEIDRIDPQYRSQVEELIFSIYPDLRGTSGYWRTLINYRELSKERYMLRAGEAIEPEENQEGADELNEKKPALPTRKERQRRQGAAAAVKVFTSAGRIEAVKAREDALSGEVAKLRERAEEEQSAPVERKEKPVVAKAPEEQPEPSQIRFKPSSQVYGVNKFESTDEPEVAREFGAPTSLNVPSPGYVRLIGNEELEHIVKLLERAGLGFLFDGAITYARTRIDDTRFLVCSSSYFGERNGTYQGLIEIVIPDMTPECVDEFLGMFHDIDVRGTRNPADIPAEKEEKERVMRDLMIAAIMRSIGYQIAEILEIKGEMENSEEIAAFITEGASLRDAGPYNDHILNEEWFGDLLCRYYATHLGLHFKVQNIIQHQVRIQGEKEFLENTIGLIAREKAPGWNAFLAEGKAKRAFEKAQVIKGNVTKQIARPYRSILPPDNFILSGGYCRLEKLYLNMVNHGSEDMLKKVFQHAVFNIIKRGINMPPEEEIAILIDAQIKRILEARKEKLFTSLQNITTAFGAKQRSYSLPFSSCMENLEYLEGLTAEMEERPEEAAPAEAYGESAETAPREASSMPILTDELLREHGVIRTSYGAPEDGYERLAGDDMIDEVKALLQGSGFGFVFKRTDVSYARSDNPKSVIISASGREKVETVFIDVKKDNVDTLLRSFVDIPRIQRFFTDIEFTHDEKLKAVFTGLVQNEEIVELVRKLRQLSLSRINEIMPFDIEGMPDDLKRALISREITSNIGHTLFNNLILKAVNEENIQAQVLVGRWLRVAARKFRGETMGFASLEKLQKSIGLSKRSEAFFIDLFGNTFSMFINKKSILYDLKENLTEEEAQFCQDLAGFIRAEEAKGGWVTKSTLLDPIKLTRLRTFESVFNAAATGDLIEILRKVTYFNSYSRRDLRAVIKRLVAGRPLLTGKTQEELIKITKDADTASQIIKEISDLMQLKEVALLTTLRLRASFSAMASGIQADMLIQNPVAEANAVFATDGAKYRTLGPGAPNYEEKGDALRVALNGYLDENLPFLKESFSRDNDSVLLRVPIEILKALGEKDARLFVSALSTAVVIELYSATKKFKITEEDYTEYRIEKKEFKGEKNRKNTITLFLTGKDDEIKSESDLMGRISGDYILRPRDTILMPVGLYNREKDLSGLVRSSILGLRLLEIARNPSDRDFIRKTAEQFQKLCNISTTEAFDLNTEKMERYLKNLAAGDINAVIKSLRELIKLLPIKPINPEELQKIYEHAQEIIRAA